MRQRRLIVPVRLRPMPHTLWREHHTRAHRGRSAVGYSVACASFRGCGGGGGGTERLAHKRDGDVQVAAHGVARLVLVRLE